MMQQGIDDGIRAGRQGRGEGLRGEVVIRRRSEEDGQALLQLFDQPRCRWFARTAKPFSCAEEVDAWLGSGHGNLELVAVLAGAVVGFAALQPIQDASRAGGLSLCVHDDYCERGIGTALMETIIAAADVLAGLCRLQLLVLTENDAAISLYRKFGFRIECRHERLVPRGTVFLDAYMMARVRKETLASGDEMRALLARMP